MPVRTVTLQRLLLLLLILPAASRAADDVRFDVAAVDTPARTFFEGLFDGTPYNVVVDPELRGTINLKLRNVTVVEALDAAREAYGYDYRPMAGGFVILPATIQMRLFQVNYLALERDGSSRTRVTSGQVSLGPWAGRQGMSGGLGGTAMVGGAQAGGFDPLSAVGGGVPGAGSDSSGTSISTRSESHFWKELESSLRALIGNTPGREVIANPASGVIAVRATPRELRGVQDYLDRIQSIVTRQVVLEAKIIEVELSDGFQAGINWTAIGRDGSRTLTGIARGPQQGFGSNLLNGPSSPVNITPGNPITEALTNSIGGAFTLAFDSVDFNAFLELLKTQGQTRVLSSPRVSTLNNQKAVIKAGSDEFFVTNVASNTVVGTASATNQNVELTPFFSGIALDVTPQIAEDGAVILHIHPTVSEVTERIKSLQVSGSSNQLPLAFSEVRESDSVVTARSGQVIVIGGLMRNTRRASDYRVPVLGDIPGVRNLFRSQRRVEVKSELVILLRPVVVASDKQWADLIREPMERAAGVDPRARLAAP